MERNVSNKLPTDAAHHPRKSKTSTSTTPSQTLQSLISLSCMVSSAGLNVTNSGGVLLSSPQSSRHTQPQNHMLISSYQLHRLQTAQLTLPYAQLFNRNVVTRDGIGQGAEICDPPVHFRLPSNWFYSNSKIWAGNNPRLLLLLLFKCGPG